MKLCVDDVAWREVDGEIVMLHLHQASYLSLNRTASALWIALSAGASQDELVQELVDRFDVDEAVAAHDVDRFLAQLRTRQLLD